MTIHPLSTLVHAAPRDLPENPRKTAFDRMMAGGIAQAQAHDPRSNGAGRVEAVGGKIRKFKTGDEV